MSKAGRLMRLTGTYSAIKQQIMGGRYLPEVAKDSSRPTVAESSHCFVQMRSVDSFRESRSDSRIHATVVTEHRRGWTYRGHSN